MRRLLQRLWRLLGESRIRLPAMRPPRPCAGDRLGIGSRLWRVEGRSSPSGAAAVLELRTLEEPSQRARLHLPPVASPGRWRLQEGVDVHEVDWRDVVCFPVGGLG